MSDEEWRIESMDVMEPRIYKHDALKVIYINEAYAEKLEDKDSPESAQYNAMKAENPDYVTRLRRIPMTIDYMKRYCRLVHDQFMLDLIKRKEPVLRREGELYEVSSFFAFKNMFLAKYPGCENVFKTTRKMDEYEKAHPEAASQD